MLHHRRPLVAALALTLLALPADMLRADDDPAFTTIINVPPDEAPSEIGSNTQLNLDDGGELPFGFQAGQRAGSINIEVDIAGGVVRPHFEAYSGSVVDISGGRIGPDISGWDGIKVRLYGGDFLLNGTPATDLPEGLTDSDLLTCTLSDGRVFIFTQAAGDYMHGSLELIPTPVPSAGQTVWNVPHDPPPKGLRAGQWLNLSSGGVLPDYFAAADATLNIVGGTVGEGLEVARGSVGVTAGRIGDRFAVDGKSIVNISGGNIGERFVAHGGSIVNMSDGRVSQAFSLRDNATLNLSGGFIVGSSSVENSTVNLIDGIMGAFFRVRWNSTLNISGGFFGPNAEINGSTVNVTGGEVGNGVLARSNSVLNVNGGLIGDRLQLNEGSVLNLSRGQIGDQLSFRRGSQLRMTGGVVGEGLTVVHDSSAIISGGRVGPDISATQRGSLTLVGGEFQIDGNKHGVSLASGLLEGQVLSGTLADGSPFIFSTAAGDHIGPMALNMVTVSLPNRHEGIIEVPAAPVPNGLRTGEALNLNNQGVLPDSFAAFEATLNIRGGRVGDYLEVSESDVLIRAGEVGDYMMIYVNSRVEIRGGSIGRHAYLRDGRIDMYGGRIGTDFRALSLATVNLYGGTIGDDAQVGPNCTLNISGGEVEPDLAVGERSTVNISGGTIGDSAYFGNRVTLNVSGGTVGSDSMVQDRATVNISGGQVGNNFSTGDFTEVNISGGQIGDGFSTGLSNTINLFGLSFFVDGEEITDSLTVDDPHVLIEREVTLAGVLADGSPFTFDLYTGEGGVDHFSHDSTVKITLVPEPGGLGLLGVGALAVLRRRRRRSV